EPARALAVEEPDERLEGLVLEHVTILAAPSESPWELLALTGLEEGLPYAGAEVRRAVKVLYQLGRFENVYASAARVGNGVSLELVLPPRPKVRSVEVVGHDALSTAAIEEALGLAAGVELDTRTFAARRQRLQAEYERIGHRSAAVGLQATRVDDEGSHDVLVRIDEGPRTRITRVVVEGTPRLTPHVVRTIVGLDRGDVLDLDEVRRSVALLAEAYRERGFLEVAIDEPRVRPVEETIDGEPGAELVVHVDAGPRVAVRFEGHEILPVRELSAAASIMRTTETRVMPKTWSRTGPAALAEVRERILARYERRGYWQADVRSHVRTSADGANKEILFSIHEGPGSWVASIAFVRTSSTTRAVSPLLEDDFLREKVYEVVAETLSEELGAPGVDPGTADALVGDGSLGPRGTPQPDTTSPNPRRIYVPRAYLAARDAIGDLYRSQGYQTVEVSAPIVRPRGKNGLVDVTFEIDEGVRWELGALSLSGNESIGSSALLEIGKLDTVLGGSAPLSFYDIDESKRAMLEHYRNEGHLYARLDVELREVPPRGSLSPSEFVKSSTTGPLRVREICAEAEARGAPSCQVELLFRFVEGPQVRARRVIVRGVETTRESLVRSQIAVGEGAVLRESEMLSTRQNLLRVGVFERVSVRPIDEKTEADQKDVLVELRERKHEAIELGAGASTAEGLRVFASYAHDNLFGTALRLQVNGKANVQPFLILYDDVQRPKIEAFYDRFDALQRAERELAVGLSYPRIFGLPPGFGAGLDLSVVHDLSPAYLQDTFAAGLRFDYKGLKPVLNEKQRPITLQLRAGFEYSVLECNEAALTGTSTATDDVVDPSQLCTPDSRSTPRGTSIYGTIGPLVAFDLRDDSLNPTAGFYLELESSFAKALNPGATDFLKVEGTANLYLPLGRGVGLAFSLFAGHIFALQDGSIPVNRRYFAGGSKTVRGYDEQSLFPQDLPPTEGQRLSSGGLLVFALKNELRFPLVGALSAAFFYDVGDLFYDPAAFTVGAATRQAAGLGVRYATPVGPLSLDVGFPLVRRDAGELGPVLHFSVRSF
ncbi:BamA/TamA family outer membrane protein, partial [Myxococcota bacterium]|nr:BamA/TamA family outer membrane protein [Myxococcota bacterium]